jgi:hypothetical protein
MVLLLALLCLMTLLKLVAISNAIRWLGGDAGEWREEVVRCKPRTVLALETQLQMYRANFFPFGLKEYRLAGYMRRLPRDSFRSAAAWWALVLLQKVFFQFQGLAAVGGMTLVLGAHAPPGVLLASRDVYGGAGAALGILLMVGIILLTCESFLSYVVLGSYGAAFHRLDARRLRVLNEAVKPSMLLPEARDRNLAIIEMFAYAGIFLTAFAITTSATYFISLQLGGFQTVADPAGHGLIGWRRLYDALYATVNIAGGSSEGNPDHVLTMFIGMLGTITYLLLTVIVLAALAGIAINAPSDPPASAPAATAPTAWVLQIRTLGGGTHEFEIDDNADIAALRAVIAKSIGSEGKYQGSVRCPGATGGTATFTIAWRNVAAASLYHRTQRAPA